jgi:hypothetical protein
MTAAAASSPGEGRSFRATALAGLLEAIWAAEVVEAVAWFVDVA